MVSRRRHIFERLQLGLFRLVEEINHEHKTRVSESVFAVVINTLLWFLYAYSPLNWIAESLVPSHPENASSALGIWSAIIFVGGVSVLSVAWGLALERHVPRDLGSRISVISATWAIHRTLYLVILRSILSGVRFCAPLLQTDGFILFSGFELGYCGALAMAAVLCPIVAFVATLLDYSFSREENAGGWFCRSNSFGDALEVMLSTITVCLFTFENLQTVRYASLLVFGLVMMTYTAYVLPFYDLRTCKLKAGTHAMCAFAALISLVLTFVPFKISHYWHLLAIVPATFIAHGASELAASRYKRLTGLAKLEDLANHDCFWFPFEVEIATRGFISSSYPSPESINQADALFKFGLNKFRGSCFLRLAYVEFLLAYRDPNSTMVQLRKAAKRAPEGLLGLPSRCRIFQDNRRRIATIERSLGESSLTFQEEFRSARALNREALMRIILFWKTLMKQDLNPEILLRLSAAIGHARRRANEKYRRLLARFPTSKRLIRAYCAFLVQVQSEPELAEQLMAEAEENGVKLAHDSDSLAGDTRTCRRLSFESLGTYSQSQRGMTCYRRPSKTSDSTGSVDVASSRSVRVAHMDRSGTPKHSNSEMSSGGQSSFPWTRATSQDDASDSLASIVRPPKRATCVLSRFRDNLAVASKSAAISTLFKRTAVVCVVAFLLAFGYLVSVKTLLANTEYSIELLNKACSRSRYSQEAVLLARRLYICSRSDVPELLAATRTKLWTAMKHLSSLHRYLFVSAERFRFQDVDRIQNAPLFNVSEFVHGDQPIIRYHMRSLWEVGNGFVRKGADVSLLSLNELEHAATNMHFRFVVDNGPRVVLDAFRAAVHAYCHQNIISGQRHRMLEFAFIVSLLLLLLVVRHYLIRPVVGGMEKERKIALSLFLALPKKGVSKLLAGLRQGEDDLIIEEEEDENASEQSVAELTQDKDCDDFAGLDLPGFSANCMHPRGPGGSAQGKGQKAKSAVKISLDVWSYRWVIVSMMLLFALLTAMFSHAVYTSTYGLGTTVEITGIAERGVLVRRLHMLALELMYASNATKAIPLRHAGLEWTAQQIRQNMIHDVESLANIHRGVVFGSLQLGFKGSSQRNEHVEALMYASPAFAAQEHQKHFPAERSRPSHLMHYGLDASVTRMIDETWALINAPERELCLENQHFVAMQDLDEGLLSRQIDETIRQFELDAVRQLKKATRIQESMFEMAIVVALVIYVLVFAPLMRDLQEEGEITLSLLLMIPAEVLHKVDVIRSYIVDNVQLEAKNMEQTVEESREETKAVMEAVYCGIIVIDVQGSIQSLNHAAERIFGFERSEVLGEPVSKLIPPDVQDPESCIRLVALSTGGGKSPFGGTQFEVIAMKKDGTAFPLMLAVTELRTGGRNCYIGAVEDITERKLAEQKLRRSEEQNRSILQAALDGIITTDEQFTILQVNSAVERMFGYTEAEAVGLKFEQLVPRVASIETGGIGQQCRLDGYRKEGSAFPVEVGLSDFSVGNKRMFTAVLRDMTDAQQQEQAINKAMVEAQASNEAKRTFLANVSHEIRTPLNGIIGMSQMLLETDMSGEQREYASVIKNCGTSLLGIVNDVLDFSKIEAGRLDLEQVDFDLAARVDHVLDCVWMQALHKNLEVMSLIHPGCPTKLRGDPQRLSQILLNFLGNALKFTKQGHIVLQVKPQMVSDTDCMLRFEVSDSGVGIKQLDLDKLFVRFSQVDSSSSRRFEGTGLGLAISKQLAHLMGGKIGVESVFGQGSCFWFTAKLEVWSPDTQLSHIASLGCSELVAPGVFSSCTRGAVMVVSSNQKMASVLCDFLDDLTINCQVASDVSDALRILRTPQVRPVNFSTIIVNQTSDLDAVALATHIRADSRLSPLRLIVLYLASPSSGHAQPLHFDTIIRKPVTQHKLLQGLLSARPPAAKKALESAPAALSAVNDGREQRAATSRTPHVSKAREAERVRPPPHTNKPAALQDTEGLSRVFMAQVLKRLVPVARHSVPRAASWDEKWARHVTMAPTLPTEPPLQPPAAVTTQRMSRARVSRSRSGSGSHTSRSKRSRSRSRSARGSFACGAVAHDGDMDSSVTATGASANKRRSDGSCRGEKGTGSCGSNESGESSAALGSCGISSGLLRDSSLGTGALATVTQDWLDSAKHAVAPPSTTAVHATHQVDANAGPEREVAPVQRGQEAPKAQHQLQRDNSSRSPLCAASSRTVSPLPRPSTPSPPTLSPRPLAPSGDRTAAVAGIAAAVGPAGGVASKAVCKAKEEAPASGSSPHVSPTMAPRPAPSVAAHSRSSSCTRNSDRGSRRVSIVDANDLGGLCGMRILLAEDNKINARITRHIVEKFGCFCDVAENGQEAVDAFRGNSAYDAILMDCSMPVKDGYFAAQEIRKLEDQKASTVDASMSSAAVTRRSLHVPIIALTAYATEEDRQKCLCHGMDDFCTKPILKETLQTMLMRWCTGKLRSA